ncbi:SDR family oxidoreductase [Saccharothrix coeruleofusca]|uniref:Short-chain dehydrogenase n=1 Tax=Saccharothrix coeruleofusca TaxID=33919 RepID=A0A918ANU0_9PSEU|nr:SDR family NAD(P)-dependent oxidoreductase [Saccharothrix coeruleofusca]MBP2337203.1 3-oxoacyl-[acyl-carrier protein] reductase [Saccharothrix coeruleofusca]GGP66441.1 short-chain dehydrogenase [Saccharothrix coeruleofusca]
MDHGLTGRTALLTGGTRGIGRAAALALAAAGANVMACYRRDEEAAASLEVALKETGGDHHVVRADVADPREVADLVAEAGARYGRLDVVVSNAATVSHHPLGELSLTEWQRTVTTNLTGPFTLVQHALPLLREGASVVLVGSRVARAGMPAAAHYVASKAGLAGLTRALCKELGPRGIRVNLVAPGIIETEATAALSAERRCAYEAKAALGRLGRVEEVAGAILFLAGDLSGYVTGATLDVDGGV